MIPKLNNACFTIRSARPYLSVWRSEHDFFYFHFIMSYDIIFWDNSSQNNSIFKMQKWTNRVIVNSSSRTSCCELFKELQILTLHSHNRYSLLTYVAKNRYLFKSNSDVCNLGTRYNSDLHLPTANLTIFQKGVFYLGIKMYIHLPQSLKSYHKMLESLDWLSK